MMMMMMIYLTKYSSRLVRTITDPNTISKDKDQKKPKAKFVPLTEKQKLVY